MCVCVCVCVCMWGRVAVETVTSLWNSARGLFCVQRHISLGTRVFYDNGVGGNELTSEE